METFPVLRLHSKELAEKTGNVSFFVGLNAVKNQEIKQKVDQVPNVAYLVIRDSANWSGVFPRILGRTGTIGGAPASPIVIREDQVSHQHAEIFTNRGKWTIRDLDSHRPAARGIEHGNGGSIRGIHQRSKLKIPKRRL